MNSLTGYDAAFCPPNPPPTDIVLFYGPGGDQLNVWTLSQIEAQTAPYRLPIFVRSNPEQANAAGDADEFIAWLRAIGAPPGVVTVLDLETAIDVAYVNTYGEVMHEADYLVLPYGSSSTLFKNPELDGYFVAIPGATAIPANCVGVQYGQGGGGAWDLDLFDARLAFWQANPPVPIPVQPPSPRGDAMLHEIQFTTDSNGNGYEITTIPWADFMAVSINGSDPAPGADDAYWGGTPHVQNRGGFVLVSVVGFIPNNVATVFVLATS